jgi:hypothetical protein
MGNSMTVRVIESSELGSFPFPVTMSGGVAIARPAPIPAHDEECATDEVPTAAGCLRGLCWGLALEAAAGVILYGAWRLLLFLR